MNNLENNCQFSIGVFTPFIFKILWSFFLDSLFHYQFLFFFPLCVLQKFTVHEVEVHIVCYNKVNKTTAVALNC